MNAKSTGSATRANGCVARIRRAIVPLSCLCFCPFATWPHELVVGQPAPDFHARTFDGKDISLADYKGQVLVINLWATWCAPCRHELPLLNSFYQLQKKFGLAVIALATEDSVSPSQLKPLAAAVGFPFIRKMKGPYVAMGGLPTNYVVDRNGIVRYARAGAFDLDGLNDTLVPLLREKKTDPADAP